MWKSTFCTSILFVLVMIAVPINVLMVQNGDSSHDRYDAKALWGGVTLDLRVDFPDGRNETFVRNYAKLHSELCDDRKWRDEDWCDDLKSFNAAGAAYLTFAITANVLLLLAVLVGWVTTMARCCCKKPCFRSRCVALTLHIIILVLLVVAVATYGISFSSNDDSLDKVLEAFMVEKMPIAAAAVDWKGARVGPSLGMLCSAIAVSVCTCWLVAFEKGVKRRASAAQNGYVRAQEGMPDIVDVRPMKSSIAGTPAGAAVAEEEGDPVTMV